jgi:hypothetical protein
MIFLNLQIQIFWKCSKISPHWRGWVWLMLTHGNTHMFQSKVIWHLYKMFQWSWFKSPIWLLTIRLAIRVQTRYNKPMVLVKKKTTCFFAQKWFFHINEFLNNCFCNFFIINAYSPSTWIYLFLIINMKIWKCGDSL